MIKDFFKIMFNGLLVLLMMCLIIGGAIGGFFGLAYLIWLFPYVTIPIIVLIIIYCLGADKSRSIT